jgi:hypothetical protein
MFELVSSKIKEVKVQKEEEVEAILPTFEIKKEVKTMILTFVIKVEHVEDDEAVQKKGRIKWHTNVNAGIHKQIFKLHLFLLGLIIIIPKRLISF